MKVLSKFLALTFVAVIIAILAARANGVATVTRALAGGYSTAVGALAKLA